MTLRSLVSNSRRLTPVFYDNETDSENRQRLKNGLFLKMWVKNTTRDQLWPMVPLTVVILLVGAALLVRACG
jgi:hypothetical protein